MANLRLIAIKVYDSTTIRAKFSEDLDPLINTSNVEITSNIAGVPDARVLKVEIQQNIITIKVRPLTPYVSYFVEFKSTDSYGFKSIRNSYLFEDGKNNKPTILGAEDPQNPVRDFFLSYINAERNVYNNDYGTVVRDIINSQSENLARALYDIGQLKNDNYLSVNIIDEIKVRGAGPFDRFVEEGVYEVTRVSKRPTGTTSTSSYSFSEFPTTPVTLQSVRVGEEILEAGTGASTFNGLVLTVAKNFVTKLVSATVNYQNGDTFSYNLSQYGYQLQDPRYDELASTYLLLETNQIKLSDAILESSFELPVAGDEIVISYEYKDKGRLIDKETVTVTYVLDATREVVPASLNQFTLQHAPIVTSTDVLQTVDGVTFLDPSANPPFSSTHPGFTKEIQLRFDRLPIEEGEFAVDYETGNVYVYGIDGLGTGDFPPVATYKYRKTYNSKIDYTYDDTLSELASNPLRTLTGEPAKISFSYEQVLVPDVDYVAQIHAEVLDERIDNRIVSSNSVATANAPITNVFRVFNETTGEIYKITRWNNDRIYFSGTNLPRIVEKLQERASFENVNNETLIVNEELTSGSAVRIFKVLLLNNRIMSATEDCVGSSINTSLSFSRTDIFAKELYFDNQVLLVDNNIDRLEVSQYQVDYQSGIIYLAVASDQTYDLGSANYKKSIITPQNSHVTAVTKIYHSIDNLTVSKYLDFVDFDEGEIQPSSYSRADERFLNGDETLPYVYSDADITVTDSVKDVRAVYDVYDLNNNTDPTNFSEGATVSGNVITLDTAGVQKQETLSVAAGGIINVTNISPGAEIVSVFSVVRLNDNTNLWFEPGTFSNYAITLDGYGTPLTGDVVLVTYNVALNGSSTPVVDYNRGDYFIDYEYLFDEILVSYEHGDNVLDFRNSDAIDTGKQYYVSYKMGALRDALLKNFGSLVNLPILNNFDTSLPRERYRDALKAALQSFPKGPTIPAIKSIVSNITHVEPELEEANFLVWSLGQSYLYPKDITITGTPEFTTGKYDYGMLLTQPDQTVSFLAENNIRLEEGTLEMWVIPEWNGLDNDATLTFTLEKDGYAMSASDIYIGSTSYNPTISDSGTFTVNRTDEVTSIGLPSAIYTKTGFFIYYDDDQKYWKAYARDTMQHVYKGTIESSGEVYDVKFIPGLGEITDILRSGTNKINFEFYLDNSDLLSPDGYVDGYVADGYYGDGYFSADGYYPGDGYVSGYSFDGIKFMADDEHYLFDFGKTNTTNRFSLFKDGKGYLNFRVYDKGTKKGKTHQFKVSSDISAWESGEKHHVAMTWRLNSSDHRDEMHLFIDGTEVSNIIKYGGRPVGTSSDRFRTVKPEYITEVIVRPAIAGNDLNITTGSNIVYSASNNFSSQNVLVGDEFTINEVGFGTYFVTEVNGNYLTLSSSMTATLTDVDFSVNQFSVVVATNIDLYKNVAVSVLRDGEEIELPGLRADIPAYSISKNQLNENVLTVLGNVLPGDQVLIRTLGLNYRRCRDKQYFWGNETSVFKTQLPSPINLDEAWITSLLLPATPIGPSNSVYSLGIFTATLNPTETSNDTEGRTLAVSVTGGNVNFSTPVTVTINGTTAGGPVTEVITFTAYGTKYSVEKWKTITNTVVTAQPFYPLLNSTTVTIKERYPITVSEGNSLYPVIRYSYRSQQGTTLSGDGTDVVTDLNGFFVQSNIGQKIVIISPALVAGTYSITEYISDTSVRVSPTPAGAFTSGVYSLYNTSLGRSGFQNGYFALEEAGTTNTPYPLPKGWYEFDYASHLEIPFDPISGLSAYVGSDRNGAKQAKAVIDELRILSKRLTDVRVGEDSNTESITADSVSLNPFVPTSTTLTLIHFNSENIKNDAEFWVSANSNFVQANDSVNDYFGQSLVVTEKPYVVDNEGYLTTTSEGTIEFWVSPRYDTYNDHVKRFYFDASSAVTEEVFSITAGTVKTSGRISRVLSVKLLTNPDGDDYYAGGEVLSDYQTIKLNRKLPNQQVKVLINYVPSGTQGDRISILKNEQGYIVFNVTAQGQDYQVSQPIFWARDTWHRIMVTFKFNRADNRDELRLFVDGEERGIITFGSGLLFGQGYVFGQGFSSLDNSKLSSNIDFKDQINEFYIGSDYLRTNSAFARIDNLRISNIARRPVLVSSQPKDINYNSNLTLVYPVVEDGPTTYLFDFNSTLQQVEDLTLLKNDKFGIFDFILYIIDSFGIVSDSAKVKQVLEILIRSLKPAQSRVQINYVD